MISRHLGTEAQGSFANTGPNEVVFIAVGAPESNSVFDAVVIGAGQAGLSTSYHLSRLGVAQLGVFRRKEAQRSVRQRFSNAAAFEDDMVHEAAGDGPAGGAGLVRTCRRSHRTLGGQAPDALLARQARARRRPGLARARAAPPFRSAGFHQPRQLTLLPGVEEIGVTRVEPSRRER